MQMLKVLFKGNGAILLQLRIEMFKKRYMNVIKHYSKLGGSARLYGHILI